MGDVKHEPYQLASILWLKMTSLAYLISFLSTQKQPSGLLCGKSVFTGKRLRWDLFLNKVTGFQPATLLKK